MCIGAASRDNAVGNAGKVGMPGNVDTAGIATL